MSVANFEGHIPYANVDKKGRFSRIFSLFKTSSRGSVTDLETRKNDVQSPSALEGKYTALVNALKEIRTDKGLPIRDFLCATRSGPLYVTVDNAVLNRVSGVTHGSVYRLTKGDLAGAIVTVVGIRAGHLLVLFGDEQEAEILPGGLYATELREVHGLVPVRVRGIQKTVRIRKVKLEVPESVHAFLMFAPDLTWEFAIPRVETAAKGDVEDSVAGSKFLLLLPPTFTREEGGTVAWSGAELLRLGLEEHLARAVATFTVSAVLPQKFIEALDAAPLESDEEVQDEESVL